MSTRDAHKSRVYAAEGVVFDLLDHSRDGNVKVMVGGSTLNLRADGTFTSLSGVQQYINGVLGDLRVLATWGDVRPIEVVKRHGPARAHYHGGRIAVPVVSSSGHTWRELYMLHETTHHLVRECYGFGDIAIHGAEFVASYIRLTEIILGGETGLALLLAMSENGAPNFWKPLADLRARAVA